ncbi:MAG: C4-type zinc ribbon domain-containing protein [Candidatus Acidiferrales bacterium]
MLPILKHLIDLQAVDVHLLDVRARLAIFPKRLAEVDARVAAARAELDHAKAAHLNAFKERKKYELDVEQWKEKSKKYKDQSYQVKTNDAFKALQHEAQMADDEIAKAEDRLLEEMVSGEQYERQIKASEKALKEIEEAAKTDRARLEAERATAEKERAQFEAERATAVAAIPEDLLDHYNRIARKHGGTALAEVQSEMCGACGVRIRPHVFQEMRRDGNEELHHCETCTRILYYIEPPAPPAPPATADSASSNPPIEGN